MKWELLIGMSFLLIVSSFLVSAYTPQNSSNVSLVLRTGYVPQNNSGINLVLVSSYGESYVFNCSSGINALGGSRNSLVLTRNFNDSVKNSFLFERTQDLNKDYSEYSFFGDNLMRGFVKFFNTHIVYNEELNNIVSFFRVEKDSVVINNLVESTSLFNKRLQDEISVSSLMKVLRAYQRKNVESVSVGDLLSKMGLFNKNEVVKVETFDYLFKRGVFKESVDSSVNVGYLIKEFTIYEKEFGDNISVYSLLSHLGVFDRRFDLSVKYYSSVYHYSLFNKFLNDFVSVSSNNNRKFFVFRRLSDVVLTHSITKNIVYKDLFGYMVNLHDGLSVSALQEGWLFCKMGHCKTTKTMYKLINGGGKVLVEYTAYPVYYGDVPITYEFGKVRVTFDSFVRESFDWLFNKDYFSGVVVVLLLSILFSSLAYYKMVRFKKGDGHV